MVVRPLAAWLSYACGVPRDVGVPVLRPMGWTTRRCSR